MKWPWQRSEHRQSQPFTDAVVAALAAGYSGESSQPSATAALEAASGVVSRGFAAATVENAPPAVVEALTPATLALIARNLMRRGEDVHVIDVRRGRIRLLPAGSWDLRGGHDPDSWFVRADLFGPSGNITRFLPHSAVLHCRYSVDPARPWLGIAPLGWAAISGRLHAGALTALEADTKAASAYVVAVPAAGETPEDADDDPLQGLKNNLVRAKGKSLFVETTKSGWGSDLRESPSTDFVQRRLGPEPSSGLVELAGQSGREILAACGVDPLMTGLSSGGDGTALREAYRRYERLTLAPLARIVTTELRDKLDAPDLVLGLAALRASDFAGVARALKAMIEAGVSVEAAGAILDIEV